MITKTEVQDMRERRENSYPPPPFWPARLTSTTLPELISFTMRIALFETDEIRHTYIADGWPGPCWTEWSGSEFVDWWPALTIARAKLGAAR